MVPAPLPRHALLFLKINSAFASFELLLGMRKKSHTLLGYLRSHTANVLDAAFFLIQMTKSALADIFMLRETMIPGST
jgi:hypothetical protein